MLRRSTMTEDGPLAILPGERTRCNWITGYVIVQCILVYIGALSIHFCAWSPEHCTNDWDKLARIMYLYDPGACGYTLRASPALINVQLSNDTRGLNVLPIRWKPAVITVSTRLSSKTRRYIYTSMFYHAAWLLSAIALAALKTIKNSRVLKIVFTVFFVVTFCIIFFDVAMALVNITHIQKSLDKGMILRYSGWSVEMKLTGYSDFGGWLPIAATACWLRGVIFFCLNVYCFAVIRRIRLRLQKSEVRKRLQLQENKPIPDANLRQPMEENVLYYRKGENRPIIGKGNYYN